MKEKIKYYPITFSDEPMLGARTQFRGEFNENEHYYHIVIESQYHDKYAEFTTTSKTRLKKLMFLASKGFYRRFVRAANKYNKDKGFSCIDYAVLTDKDIRNDIDNFMSFVLTH